MTAIAAEGRHSQAKSPNPTAAAGVSGAAAAAGAAAPGVRSFAVGGDDWQENEEGSEEEGEGSGVLLAEVDDGEQHQGGEQSMQGEGGGHCLEHASAWATQGSVYMLEHACSSCCGADQL